MTEACGCLTPSYAEMALERVCLSHGRLSALLCWNPSWCFRYHWGNSAWRWLLELRLSVTLVRLILTCANMKTTSSPYVQPCLWLWEVPWVGSESKSHLCLLGKRQACQDWKGNVSWCSWKQGQSWFFLLPPRLETWRTSGLFCLSLFNKQRERLILI